MRHLSSHPNTVPAGSKAPTFRKASFIYSLWFYPQLDSEVWFLALWLNNRPKLSLKPKTDRAVSFSCSFLCSNETLCVGASSQVLRRLNRSLQKASNSNKPSQHRKDVKFSLLIHNLTSSTKTQNWHERQTSASSEILHVYSHFTFMIHNLSLCRLKKSKHIFFIQLKKTKQTKKAPKTHCSEETENLRV